MVANAKPFDRTAIRTALESSRRTEGSTHNFYLYPARFSPEAAATVILGYTDRNDWILDPFMGGAANA
jgi:hypothetical protein